jgi:hypothetical protein
VLEFFRARCNRRMGPRGPFSRQGALLASRAAKDAG